MMRIFDRGDRYDSERMQRVKRDWREACEGVELCQFIETPSGFTLGIPQVVHITLGPPVQLVVQLRPGQALCDIEAVADRIAEAMGAPGLVVTRSQAGWPWVRVDLVRRTPETPTARPLDVSPATPAETTPPRTWRPGPSPAWTRRLHPWPRKPRRPEQRG